MIMLKPLEWILNRVLRLDPELHRLLQPLIGKTILVCSTLPPLKIAFIFTAIGIELRRNAQTANVTLTGNSLGFLQTQLAQGSMGAIRKNHIQIEGDLETAEAFQNFFNSLDLDIEAYLAQKTNDNITSYLSLGLATIKKLQQTIDHTLRQNLEEYAQEECQLLPHEIELENFYHEVQKLQQDVERLQKKVLHCIAQQGNSS